VIFDQYFVPDETKGAVVDFFFYQYLVPNGTGLIVGIVWG
jgi:hypothetical protein